MSPCVLLDEDRHANMVVGATSTPTNENVPTARFTQPHSAPCHETRDSLTPTPFEEVYKSERELAFPKESRAGDPDLSAPWPSRRY